MGSELETSRCVPSVGITHAVRDVPGWTDGERELQTFPTCEIMHEIWLPERRLGVVYPFRPILWEPWLRGCGKVFARKVFEVGFPEDPVLRLLCLGGLWLLALIFFRVEDGGSTKIPNCSECSSLKCHRPSTCHDKIRLKKLWARRDKKAAIGVQDGTKRDRVGGLGVPVGGLMRTVMRRGVVLPMGWGVGCGLVDWEPCSSAERPCVGGSQVCLGLWSGWYLAHLLAVSVRAY